MPYDWVEDDPIDGRRHELDRDRDGEGGPGRGRDAERRRPRASSATRSSASSSVCSRSRSACSGCRRCGAPTPKWLAAFMALTAGLLTFLGIEALFEAFELQAALPGDARRRRGSCCSASRSSFLTITFFSARTSRREGRRLGPRARDARRGRHRPAQPRRGPRDRHARSALGELTLGTFLIVGFMIHNITEGLGIAAPLAEEGKGRASRCRPSSASPRSPARPAILGAWIGGYSGSDVLGGALLRRSPRAPRSRSWSR